MGDTKTVANRDTVLLSHANPEDNEFTLWLSLQLASEGYKVWCDLTKLLGGETFWDDIENVLRTSAIKVLYVLSKTSNSKDGPLRELQLAQSIAKKEKLKDFVIPLHIDDLPHHEITIELSRVITMPFHRAWADGLATLLKKLEDENVPKSPSFNRSAVSEWWRNNFGAAQGVREEPEDHLSNWFPIKLPENVYFHSIARNGIGKIEVSQDLPYPAVQDGISLITFAKADAFEGKLGSSHYIAQPGTPMLVADLLAEEEGIFGKHLFRLLRLTWEHLLKMRSLPVYVLANDVRSFYFKKDQIPADKASYTDLTGKERFRGMVGYSNKKNTTTGIVTTRYWHFGLEARPQVHPVPCFVMKPHVVFSNDGQTIWSSKKKLAAARQNQCKGWWNDKWRDCTLAALAQLGEDGDAISMPVAPDEFIKLSRLPILFRSPVAYTDPQELDEDAIIQIAEDFGRSDREDEDALEDSE